MHQATIVNLHTTGAIDADGVHDDLAIVADLHLQVLRQTPDFQDLESIDLTPTDLVHALRIVDLNADGLGDVVALIEDTDTSCSSSTSTPTAPPTFRPRAGPPARSASSPAPPDPRGSHAPGAGR
jgi:hypothetical protein